MKRLQIDLPDYICQMLSEINQKSDWKEKEIVIRAIEHLYRHFILCGSDIVRLTKVYRKIDSDKDFGLFYKAALHQIEYSSSVRVIISDDEKTVRFRFGEGAADE